MEESTTTEYTPPVEVAVTPKHMVKFKLPGTVKYKNGDRSESWRFSNHISYKWLVENCEDWRWDWGGDGSEDDNGCMDVDVLFYSNNGSAMAFKLKWT